MDKHLPNIDFRKLSFVLAVKEQYLRGEISLEEGQRALKEKIDTIKPYEIALAEQQLKEIEDDECRKEDIQSMLALFDGIIDISRPSLPDNHPIMCYYRENDEMRKLLKEVEKLIPHPIIKNEWLGLYDELAKWRTHLSRKQNQLYSVLERKGFDRPTTTMWLLDDFIRDEIRENHQLLEDDKDEEFIARQKTLIHDILDLITKEESVLYPTSLAMITDQEFEEMKSGDHEIGYAYISVEGTFEVQRPNDQIPAMSENFATELTALLSKYGLSAGHSKENTTEILDVATGKLTLEQINLIYQHMPVDISYVDEHEIVKFYTDTEHRIFPRSKNVIGRDVKNCHPRTSVHLVKEIIEKFRTGEQDSVDFWINKPDLFIYIYYVAVRDTEGRFRGVLEMMQDCTRIRQLQDSRTLLKWSKDTAGTSHPDKAHHTEPSDKNSNEQSQNENSRQEKETQTYSYNQGEENEGDIDINPNTRLKVLLERYPNLKQELVKIHPNFKMLSSPLARIIIPKANVRMMSERSGVKMEQLIKELTDIIARLR